MRRKPILFQYQHSSPLITLAVYLVLHIGFNESLLRSFPSVKEESILLALSTDQSVSNSVLKLLNFSVSVLFLNPWKRKPVTAAESLEK